MSEPIKEWGIVLDPPIELHESEIPGFLTGLAKASEPIEEDQEGDTE